MKAYMRTIWDDLVKNKVIIILLSLVWILLFEEFTLFISLTGLFMAIVVVLFTNRFMLKGDYQHTYMIGLLTLAEYGARLLTGIWLAGFEVIPYILSGKTDVQIISCETKLSDELLINILANSITLTPGTVTVEKKGNQLRVLALNPPAEDGDPRDVIPYKLENVLLRYENKLKKGSRP
ncbi:multicomponent Na+:H+ antiporter subunit E [Alkalibacterium putridalgicola]|uniref:Multicomponent Na+:H+ antiporter subunit E n=1 Tax=Alkalibacterium putridalgicola TaxID=426703 RepID=A0A1H7S7U0_9LACT|nr:Na+/H+ antiporter subunit E [Alkalibacterium putridalgicola]GEK89093.1 hypothetical protein APU01nite_11320 [Alkalibacterium putridalgicola]SEL68595.1 multicomponent Na+:H+ antiporter subunit E [Alkalibacterium putridalgicola]